MVGLCIAVGIIAGIILLFASVLSVRAHIHVEYEQELIAYAKWSLLKIPLLPRPQKPPKEKKKEEPKKEEAPKPKEEEAPKKEPKPKGPNPLATLYENEQLNGIMEILRNLLQVVGKFGKGTVNSFVIDEMFLDITVSKPDAAETAEAYGKMCRKVFPVTGAVVANCNVRQYSINIDADYLSERNECAFSMEISLNPRKLINAGLSFAFGALFKVGIRVLKGLKPKNAAKDQKAGNANGQEQSGSNGNNESPSSSTAANGDNAAAASAENSLNTENNTESGVSI